MELLRATLLKKKVLVVLLLLMGVLRPPHTSEAVKCYSCVEDEQDVENDIKYKKCIKGGVPESLSDPKSEVELDCANDPGNDPSSCKMRFTYKTGSSGDSMKVEKGCVNATYLDCIKNEAGLVTSKGNCFVIDLKNVIPVGAKCRYYSGLQNSRTLTGSDSTGGDRDVVLPRGGKGVEGQVTFCTCQGALCNAKMDEADYTATGLRNPSVERKRSGSNPSSKGPGGIAGLMMTVLVSKGVSTFQSG